MTVSNAYSRPDQLSPALRDRILAVAEGLGYAGPDPVARTLSRGQTGSVGLVVDYPLTLALTDPATLQLLHGVAAGCEEREMGLSLVPRIAGRDTELVHTALVDGLVVYSLPADDPRLEAVRARRLPYVLIDHEPVDGVQVVNVDDRGGARSQVEHLLALGHRRFGIALPWDTAGEIGPDAERSLRGYRAGSERLGGWREAIEAAGLDWSAVPAATGPALDRQTGRVAGARLLDRADRPTAIVAFADVVALGVMDAAAERGISVPGELSVIGFDDVIDASISEPPLSTIRQPHAEKGAAAIRLLLDGGPSDHVLLPTELVVRSSTAPAPAPRKGVASCS